MESTLIYIKAYKEDKAIFYPVIKYPGYLRTLEKCIKLEVQTSVFKLLS